MTKAALIVLVLGLGLACGSDLQEGEPVIDYPPIDVPSPDAIEIDGELYWEGESIIDYPTAELAEEWFNSFDHAATYDESVSVEKATYVLPNKYGIAGGGVPCLSTGFPGGTCQVPKTKAGCVRRIPDTEAPLTNQDASARQAFPKWKNIITPLGWSAEHNDVACALASQQITVKFGNLGVAMGKMTPLINSSDTFTIPAGSVQPWRQAQVILDPSSIQAFVAGKTETQISNFLRNLSLHELIHAVGLAHNGIIDTLMDTSPVAAPSVSSYFLGNLSPLAAENTRLQTFSVTQ